MSQDSSPEIKVVASPIDGITDLVNAASVPFSFDPTPDEIESLSHIDHRVAALDGDTIVGTSGAMDYPVTVPGGGRLVTAGVTFVTVLPTHRRRGVLTAMMRHIIDASHEREIPLSSLWASESMIYGRFGYGEAVEVVEVEIKRASAAMRASIRPQGTIRLIEHTEALEVLPGFHDSVDWVGKFWRSREYWQAWALWDPMFDRDGHTKRRIAVYEEDGAVAGYVFFRTRRGNGERRVRVDELVAATVTASVALHEFLFGIDLTDVLHFRGRLADEPIRLMLEDRRAWRRVSSEYMWFRLVDLPACLEARGYGTAGSLTLEVADEFAPWNGGRWNLEGDSGGGQCRRTDAVPDLQIDVADLAALFMGGRSAFAMADAGRIEGDEESVKLLDAMFRSARPPWSAESY